VAAKGFQPFDGFGIPPENGEAASIDLRSIFGTLLGHWKLVSIVPLLALIGTYVIFMFVPQQFKSTTEILIANPKLQNEAGQPPSEGMSYVLSISITTPDPASSQRITDIVAKDFFAEQLEARSAALERAAGWLTNWASELRTGLSDTEAQIEKLKAESRRCDRQPA
jgi:uncharacterized protein involved in exopolysaccharide biosynthesis